ncbi:type VII secretion system family protein [Mycobacterium kansasii]|uniref:Type VII secretion system family protein n=1 Tax=Mycobacterium kansasii TaxID=1768 RepID=A0A1V3WJT6_MYCKA|nr:type VII secretion system family protein [Mycobacterium kansasii]
MVSMAAEELRVYCAELAHASKTTTGAADEIDGLRDKLGGQTDGLAGTWTGQAASAYLDVWPRSTTSAARCSPTCDGSGNRWQPRPPATPRWSTPRPMLSAASGPPPG